VVLEESQREWSVVVVGRPMMLGNVLLNTGMVLSHSM
jgi:hypothetical protein